MKSCKIYSTILKHYSFLSINYLNIYFVSTCVMNHHGQSRDLDKTFNTPARKGLRCAWEYGYYKASRRRLQNSLQVGECLIRMIPIQEGSPPPRRTGRDLRSPRQTSRAERRSCERRTCQIVSSIFGVSLGIV